MQISVLLPFWKSNDGMEHKLLFLQIRVQYFSITFFGLVKLNLSQTHRNICLEVSKEKFEWLAFSNVHFFSVKTRTREESE